jgi:hypothetical protein
MVVTYGLIESGLVAPLGLAAGFGALPLGVLLSGAFPAPTDLGSSPESASVDIDPNVKSDHA